MTARLRASILVATAFGLAIAAARPPLARAAERMAEPLVVLGAQTLFGSDRTRLSLEGRGALARLLARLDARGRALAVHVVGHADSLGPEEYNRRLSERRARAVAETLLVQRPALEISIHGAGESEPVASNATAAGRARNRRVEIHVLARERSRNRSDAAHARHERR